MKSKKKVILSILCILIIGVLVFFISLPNKPSDSRDNMYLDEFGEISEDLTIALLMLEEREDILWAWGEPDFTDEEKNMVSYYLPEDYEYEIVSLIYNEDDCVVGIFLK